MLEEQARFPRLRWDIGEGVGYTPQHPDLREIWIRSSLTAFPDLEYVAAHEVRHVWQKLTHAPVFEDPCRAEGDAYPYGYEVLKRMLQAQGRLNTRVCEKMDQTRDNAERAFRAKWPEGVFETLRM
jgi:hypothetical protein